MELTIAMSIAVCAAMISSILFFPVVRIGRVRLNTYWMVTLLGAVIVLVCSSVRPSVVGAALVADTAVNPLKILVLFLSMTALSIFLDEVGFFERLASALLGRAGKKQLKLFLFLYILVSVLTVFTSNDIIILSFTPFICYFAKRAKINPIPFLAAEFVAANTWSMALIIGNPTNIYLATAAGIGFAEYIKYCFLPTLFGGGVALAALLLIFRKKLKQPIENDLQPLEPADKLLMWVGIVHLAGATILLAISSYVGMEMWIVAVCSLGSLLLFAAIISAVRRSKPTALMGCAKRTPYQLVPFVLSMFVIIVALDQSGVTSMIYELIGTDLPILKYGTLSFLCANAINNIPMSVFFSSIISAGGAAIGKSAVFATIIGSNICAFFTPIGALAGIMWSSVIEKHGVKFGYVDFLKIGLAVALPTLFAALGGLWLATSIF